MEHLMRRTKWILIGTLAIAATLQICFGLPSAKAETGKKPLPYNVGQWLPSDQQVLEDWRTDLIRETDELSEHAPLWPVIQEFKELIENDPELFMLFTQMFEQIPHKPPFLNDPTDKPQIRNYQHMLVLMNYILTQAPEFNKTGLVGFPINAILN